MSISVNCKECSTPFFADKQHLGKKIKCPKCFAVNVVEREEDWEEWEDDDEEYRLAGDEGDNAVQANLAADLLREAAEEPTEPKVKPAAKPAPPQVTNVVCDQCKAEIPSGSLSCPQCGAESKLTKEASKDPFAIEQLDGVQGWVQNVLSEGESVTGVIVLGVLFVALMLGILSYLFYPYFLILSVPIYLALIGYGICELIASKRAGYSFAFIWALALKTGRMTKFRYWRIFGKAGLALNKRGQHFTDNDLAQIEEPETYEILDLEGTQLTNDSFETLAAFPRVRFLVLKGTQFDSVTIDRIQARHRQTWIWFD